MKADHSPSLGNEPAGAWSVERRQERGPLQVAARHKRKGRHEKLTDIGSCRRRPSRRRSRTGGMRRHHSCGLQLAVGSGDVLCRTKLILKNGYGCQRHGRRRGHRADDPPPWSRKGSRIYSSESTPSLAGRRLMPKAPPRGGSVKSGRRSATGRFPAGTFRNTWPDAHPDIKTVEDAMKHPELFPAPEDATKGGRNPGSAGLGRYGRDGAAVQGHGG